MKDVSKLANSEYLTTREIAELLRIKERKVYDLAASGKIPCSKAFGKLLFPRAEIETWVTAGRHARFSGSTPARSALTASEPTSRPKVFLGSHDPLLEWALRESNSGLAAYFDGSSDGLKRFAAAEGVAAGVHLFDAATRTWNVEAIRKPLGEQPVVLVEWAKRQRGLILRPELQGKITGLSDLNGLRFAGRQQGAGAQQIFTTLAEDAGLGAEDIQTPITLRTETDAALAVLGDKADASFGLQSLAAEYRLGFQPIIEERYDILVDRRSWFEPPMQAFIRFCASEHFRQRAQEYAGYDISGLGCVHFNGR